MARPKAYAVWDPLVDTVARFATLQEAHAAFDALILKPTPGDVWPDYEAALGILPHKNKESRND